MKHPTEAELLLAFDGELEPREAADVGGHVAICAECRAHVEQLKAISAGIVEYHQALGTKRSPRRVARVLVPAMAIAAVLLVALWIGRPAPNLAPHRVAMSPAKVTNDAAAVLKPSVLSPEVRPASRRHQHRLPIAAEVAQFIELPFSDGSLPLTDAAVVRVEIPVDELRLAGVSVDDRQPGSRVEADLLIGMDGLPRGVRLVQ